MFVLCGAKDAKSTQNASTYDSLLGLSCVQNDLRGSTKFPKVPYLFLRMYTIS